MLNAQEEVQCEESIFLKRKKRAPPVPRLWRPHGPHVGSRVSLHFDGLGARVRVGVGGSDWREGWGRGWKGGAEDGRWIACVACFV